MRHITGAGWFLAVVSSAAALGCGASSAGSGADSEQGDGSSGIGGTVIGPGGASGLGGSAGSARQGGTGGAQPSAGVGGTQAGAGGAVTGGGGAPPGADGGSGTLCGKVIYDGETVKLGSAVTWTDPNGANGSSSVSESTDNPHGGTTSMKVDLKWNTGYYGGAFGYNFGGYSASRAIDIRGAVNLEFWVRTETGTNDHFVLWIGDASGTASARDKSGGYVPLVTTTWQKFAIPVSVLTGVDLSAIWELDGDTHSNPFGSAGGVTFYLDDIVFTSPDCK